MSNVTRRRATQGVAWAIPALVATGAAPAVAASPGTVTLDYGVFVTSVYTQPGGYFGSDPTGVSTTSAPSTVPGSFSGGRTTGTSDLRWIDGSGPQAGATSYQNGSGSFTPGGTSTTAGRNDGRSGFWFSAPTTAPGTGTGYVGSATLAAGATFTTTFTYTIPAGSAFVYPTYFGKSWNTAGTATLAHLNPTGNANLVDLQAAASLTFSTPTVTTNADGSKTFTGVITTKTTEAITVSAGKIGQVTFLPQVSVYSTSYSSFSMTSQISSAVITYSGVPVSGTTLSGSATTSAIHP